MLNIFRRRDLTIRILVGSILVLVSLTMVITLIPGIMTPLTSVATGVVAEVQGDSITTVELQQSVMQLTRESRIPPEMVWLYTEQVLDEMLMEKAILHEADRLGVRVSEQDMVQRLRQIPELFPDGKFVGQEQYDTIVFNRFGVPVAEFERRFRNSIITQRLQQLVTDSVSASDGEVRDAVIEQNEKFVLSYVLFQPSELRDDIPVTDAALADYFESHRNQYQIAQKRDAKLMVFSRSEAQEAISVPENEVRDYYQRNIDGYRTEERVSASHILVRASATDPAAMEVAETRAGELLQQLKDGADFAELAKGNSEDPGSAAQGGELGFIVRGQTVPGFEAAVFSLEPGALSELVKTEFGFHLIRVSEREEARLKPFEEVQPEIETALLEEKVLAALNGKGEEAAVAWRNELDDLGAVAERMGAGLVELPMYGQGDPLPGMPDNQEVSQEIFSLEAGWVGRPISVSSGVVVPMVEEIHLPRQAEYSEVEDQVREAYKDEQSRNQAATQAQDLALELENQENKDLTAAARAAGATVAESGEVTLAGTIGTVGSVQQLAANLQGMSPGEVAGPVSVTGGQLVFQLQTRQAPEDSVIEIRKESVREQLLTAKKNLAYSLYQEELRKQLSDSGEIVVYRDVLDQLTAVTSAVPLPAQ